MDKEIGAVTAGRLVLVVSIASIKGALRSSGQLEVLDQVQRPFVL
jgi:hypothetical protein